MSAVKRRRVLAIVATDRTFEPSRHGIAQVWVGKCIFCGSGLTIGSDGTPVSAATIEHIWPRNHGGTDELENLALACKTCNREKGSRHDQRTMRDPRLIAVVEGLRAKRRKRWRDPVDVGLAALVARVSRDLTGGRADADADDDNNDDDDDDDDDDGDRP